jgi:hypothetical protein
LTNILSPEREGISANNICGIKKKQGKEKRKKCEREKKQEER